MNLPTKGNEVLQAHRNGYGYFVFFAGQSEGNLGQLSNWLFQVGCLLAPVHMVCLVHTTPVAAWVHNVLD